MPTVNRTSSTPVRKVLQDVWVVTGTDDGAPESAPQYQMKTVRAAGTWAGGTMLIEESDDGTTWWTCINNAGGAVSFTANGSMVIASNGRYIRPRASVGVTSVTVTLICTAF